MHNSVVDSNAREIVKRDIAGYVGYEDWKQRRNSETKFREHVWGILDKLEKRFSRQKAVPENDKLDQLNRHFRIGLQRLKSSLGNPGYEKSDFFSKPGPESPIDRIYELEGMVLDYLHEIDEEGRMMGQSSQEPDSLLESYHRLQAFMDNINQALFEREAAIMGDNF